MKTKYLSTYIMVDDIIHFRDLEDGMLCRCLDNNYMYTSQNGVWMSKLKNSREDWKISMFHNQRERYVKELQTYRLLVVDCI